MSKTGSTPDLQILQRHAKDETLIKEGAWCDLYEWDPADFQEGDRIRCREWQNSDFMGIMQARTRGKQRQIEDGRMPWNDQQEMMAEVISRAVITDWDGPSFSTPDGTPVAYSQPLGQRLLLQDDVLRKAVEEFAKDKARFRKRGVEDTVGNSSEPSSGSTASEGDETSSSDGGTQA